MSPFLLGSGAVEGRSASLLRDSKLVIRSLTDPTLVPVRCLL